GPLVVGAPTAPPGPGGHQHPGRADPALRAALGEEGFLQDVQPIRRAQRLDGLDPPPRDLADGHEAAVHRPAVEEDCAGAALALAAAFLRAREAEALAEDVDQPLEGETAEALRPAVAR